MDLKILQWNCRGIYRKLLEFKNYLANLDYIPDIIALQETHLIQKYSPRIRNYILLRKDRDVHGGGVCLFIKNDLPFREIELGNIGEVEAQGIKIQDVSVINIYISPGRRISRSHFEQVFAISSPRALYIGDFNAHHPLWSNAEMNANGRHLYHIVDWENLFVVNTTKPTRLDISRMRYSLIDLTIVTPNLASVTETV